MPRFHLPENLSVGQTVNLPDNIVRHLNVLRIRPNENITLFDGKGKAHAARLTILEKRRAEAEILREETADTESPLNITLIQSISSGDRMDFTLQKSVELGITAIQPVISERCIVRLDGERAAKRLARWQEIVISACEQSGRNTVPPVLPIIGYREALDKMPSESTKLIMSINRARKLGDIRQPSGAIVFMVGPEGGWTEQEEQQAFEAGFQAVTLGKRILRTETAPLAALAAMQTLWGDFA
ncbi:TPA: 16S rRNA (uracil(1498)-N(3))-methyltransferase [Neisseria meningitidis]|uniref:16S rRNA (uracil(1498)-N(3))-methyltransferase n=1 Tax=Neisseria TaxID=482 RepID=UPI000306407D|nr:MULTISPECIES: 16S rRNA (uracil(1498)-N(3))-methyltransferase [Neisseria]EOC68796.1 RNA methyltransferase, RsmE family protein [Neisseria meningitidis NM3144]RPC13168.1 16S rRNA (uracil(1498)-N(3))-methyltransferase [Neisseria meningitidis]TND50281.1 16S rRNA (uracil(1498)-N(3))-methyltransferase [Neisseria gonorrhoeae]CNR78219.1 16S ribosomal RNA methyltransferase RsmE [Neisseria gonorrhoeae]CNT32361.1 16S ribosomal RNA methyltransferase RsmE [Neisseria gonorrhoeae]